ncbi:peptide chain release factor N(5)-glutamine methyltransferase [Amedibacillus dolichus]|uniref:Release factor glutamine methyltransferase n=1 Tax=Amedibacillus dolichus TaxID=31971 RepID=A0ABT7U9K7_9FIRM|nr:peptide chain release factor N(5)-glutamine methyltransferase [Amedibacillus dolichus]MDM8156304.1 peptide chain release factor N(5)-glutamine methyltransferase [Amedibacillus dolichus]
MASYRQVLREAKERLYAAGQGEQAAQLLMLELANLEAHNLYMEYDEEVPQDLLEAFEAGIRRMEQGEPLGHVLGFEWFYGYRFKVNSDVLIPRPETEELVANILAAYDECFDGQDVDVIDVGTGSGAIAIALRKEEAHLQVTASDISEQAVAVARKNAADNAADVTFLTGDMLEPFIEAGIRCDILVSNPPYIPVHEQMEHSVVDFEPHVALFGGEDGLKFYREIFANAHRVIKEKAILAFEMGYDQGERLRALAKEHFPDARVEIIKDLSGKNRMLFVYHNL